MKPSPLTFAKLSWITSYHVVWVVELLLSFNVELVVDLLPAITSAFGSNWIHLVLALKQINNIKISYNPYLNCVLTRSLWDVSNEALWWENLVGRRGARVLSNNYVRVFYNEVVVWSYVELEHWSIGLSLVLFSLACILTWVGLANNLWLSWLHHADTKKSLR